jgi:alkylhydroperoxidase/carboxymuconolactone decarboxylase family protein YurZ
VASAFDDGTHDLIAVDVEVTLRREGCVAIHAEPPLEADGAVTTTAWRAAAFSFRPQAAQPMAPP